MAFSSSTTAKPPPRIHVLVLVLGPTSSPTRHQFEIDERALSLSLSLKRDLDMESTGYPEDYSKSYLPVRLDSVSTLEKIILYLNTHSGCIDPSMPRHAAKLWNKWIFLDEPAPTLARLLFAALHLEITDMIPLLEDKLLSLSLPQIPADLTPPKSRVITSTDGLRILVNELALSLSVKIKRDHLDNPESDGDIDSGFEYGILYRAVLFLNKHSELDAKEAIKEWDKKVFLEEPVAVLEGLLEFGKSLEIEEMVKIVKKKMSKEAAGPRMHVLTSVDGYSIPVDERALSLSAKMMLEVRGEDEDAMVEMSVEVDKQTLGRAVDYMNAHSGCEKVMSEEELEKWDNTVFLDDPSGMLVNLLHFALVFQIESMRKVIEKKLLSLAGL